MSQLSKAKVKKKTRDQVLEALRRERVMRLSFYAKQIRNGKMTITGAQHEIDCMSEAIELIESLPPAKGDQAKLFES